MEPRPPSVVRAHQPPMWLAQEVPRSCLTLRLEMEGLLQTNRYLRSLAEAATSELDLAVLSSVAAWPKWPCSWPPSGPEKRSPSPPVLKRGCFGAVLPAQGCPTCHCLCLPGVVLRRDGTQTIEGYAVLMVKRGWAISP